MPEQVWHDDDGERGALTAHQRNRRSIKAMPPLVPMRFLFRSRWAALAWCAGICWMAVSFAGGNSTNSTDNADGNAAQISALLGK